MLGQSEGYKATLEWGFWKFIKYFTVFGIIIWIASWALTRIVNLDLMVWAWHLANWWIFIPETAVAMGAVYIWHWSRKSEKKKKQQAYREHLDRLVKEARG